MAAGSRTLFESIRDYYPGKMKHYMFPTIVVHGEIMRKFWEASADFRGGGDVAICEFAVPVDEDKPADRYTEYTMREYFESYESAYAAAKSWVEELNLCGL